MELKLDSAHEEEVQVAEVLIVPYGIETVLLHQHLRHPLRFNRTLWN